MEDLHVAWMLLGWMIAFWAGKDLQARVAQRQGARRQTR